MSTSFRQSFSKAERFGHGLARLWRWLVRADGWMRAKLVRQGFPQGAATATLWLARLAALGVLMYAAMWLAALVVFAVAAAWMGRNDDLLQEEQPKWRDGMQGYGLYRGGVRVDYGSSHDD
ncbi:MAG: DUF3742 family protein [Alcaligenaceae bacterium]|nr:DUF3742 family protein [Alcaligenaceae bacterium]